MTYLTQLNLDFATAARLPLRDSYAWHQAVWHAFPGRDDSPRDFLTRLDRRQDGFRLLIVSPIEPARPNWCPSDPESWQTKADTGHVLQSASLCISALRKPDQEGRQAELRWQQDQERQARSLDHTRRDVGVDRPQGRTGGICRRCRDDTDLFARPRVLPEAGGIGPAQCCGISRHSQRDRPTAFHHTFTRGIGSAKAFGFGLLVIAPIQ